MSVRAEPQYGGRGSHCDTVGLIQAAQYDVFVTQPPDQDPERCFQRNVHGRTREEVAEAWRQHEPPPPSLRVVDSSSLVEGESAQPPLPDEGPADGAAGDMKRKLNDDEGVGGGTGVKRMRDGGRGDGATADGDSGSEMDTGAEGGGAGGKPAAPRSRWADDDDDEEEEEGDEEVRDVPRWMRGATQVRSEQNRRKPATPSANIGAFAPPPAPLLRATALIRPGKWGRGCGCAVPGRACSYAAAVTLRRMASRAGLAAGTRDGGVWKDVRRAEQSAVCLCVCVPACV